MRNFSAGGKSGLFLRPKKKFGLVASSPSATNNLAVESHFLPIDHIQQTKIKLLWKEFVMWFGYRSRFYSG